MNRDTGTARESRRNGAAARIVTVIIIGLLLAGCGKKGNPSPPPDQPSTYPRSYPRE